MAVAVPALALTLATSATAAPTANTVHWENARFPGKCLNWEEAPPNVRLAPLGGCSTSGPVDVSQWREVPVDGKYWTFRPARTNNSGNWTNMCLTSYNTAVYLETCQDGNWWQQWEEIWTSSGWKLKHRGADWVAGFYLDTDGSRMYTEPGNNGMNQVWR
ncbi:hypothetical protein ACFXPI_14115 [Streptomyces sp. NPDC059104]|uniref:hypothetical protein n=1 Tax=Streptomyces sp. NPDC059104 TaxID=3346729 RepID=UPI0036825C6A